MRAAVETRELTKVFWRRPAGARRSWFRRPRPEPLRAVDGLNLTIPEGEFFGLLGPNGAGKTTAIRMLCTLLEPTSGQALVNGYDAARQADAVRASIGVVFSSERALYWKLTGRENLAYYAALYHVPPEVCRRRIPELLELVELADRADEYVERYSSGMKQRLALAKALLNDAPVLLLDEPTVGLDPQSARHVRDFIRRLNREQGKTIILTTHYMEEADRLCDRVGVIDHGRIIALDRPASLKAALRQEDVIEFQVAGVNGRLLDDLRRLPGVRQAAATAVDGPAGVLNVRLHADRAPDLLPGVLGEVGRHGGEVRQLKVVEVTLEDVFIALTGKGLRD